MRRKLPWLAKAVVEASPDERPGVLAKLRDNKGSVHSEALARAAAKLAGDAQQETRAALAKRLTRMTPTTLRGMLKDDNREIRIGAASACGLKEDKQFVSDLIDALGDVEPLVVKASRASLKLLSGNDFGPELIATPDEKKAAIARWKNWLKSQAK